MLYPGVAVVWKKGYEPELEVLPCGERPGNSIYLASFDFEQLHMLMRCRGFFASNATGVELLPPPPEVCAELRPPYLSVPWIQMVALLVFFAGVYMVVAMCMAQTPTQAAQARRYMQRKQKAEDGEVELQPSARRSIVIGKQKDEDGEVELQP